jgi:putative ABC transport system permease protein
MRIIAIIIAFVGILGALLALQTESRKEMSILKTIGLVPSQISRLLATQSLLIGLLAGIFAIPVGISMAAGLIYVVNSRSFGWSM